MFSNAPSRQEIDRLNAVWDDVVRGNASSGSEAEMARSLQHLAPALDSAAKQRLRTRVLATQPAVTMPVRSIEPVSLRTPLTTPKSVRSGVFLRLAAVALLMLGIAGAWLGARQFGADNSSPTPLQGAIPASPSDTSANPRQTLFQLDIPPAQLREFGVYILKSELPAMARWDLSTASFTLGDQALSFYVESGVLAVEHKREGDGYGVINSYGPGSVVSGVLPSEVRVEGPSPTEILILLAIAPGDVLPQPEGIPDGIQVLSGVSVKQPAGVPLTIDFSRATAQGAGADPIQADDAERVAMVWVIAGSVMLEIPVGESVQKNPGSLDAGSTFVSSTGEPMTLNTGDTGIADLGSTLGQHGSVVGDEPFSAYVMAVREGVMADGADAEARGVAMANWLIPPDVQRVAMAVRVIRLDPGATYQYPFDGAVAYHVSAGTVKVALGAQSQDLENGESAVQIGNGELMIHNIGTHGVIVEQATASTSMSLAQLVHPVLEMMDGVVVDLFATGNFSVPAGTATVSFTALPVDDAITITERGQSGVSLIMVENGLIAVDRSDDSITIANNYPYAETTSQGEVSKGGYLRIPDGAAYTITGADEHVSTLLRFLITPNPDGASPIAILTPVDQADLTVPSPTPAYSIIEPLPVTATP